MIQQLWTCILSKKKKYSKFHNVKYNTSFINDATMGIYVLLHHFINNLEKFYKIPPIISKQVSHCSWCDSLQKNIIMLDITLLITSYCRISHYYMVARFIWQVHRNVGSISTLSKTNFKKKTYFVFKIWNYRIFHDLLRYCHMSNEVIRSLAYDNYNNFQHVKFIFSQINHFIILRII